ncbi:hypothetical protein [Qipengyuania sp. 902]|uniref:hypothetical protein n=1 Tax=Qipengyuania sp. 902 TaxID=3417565 RepID=UPI003EBB4C93
MGLFVRFGISFAPGMIVKMVRHDRLPAFIDVHVSHSLLARLVQLGQRLQCRSAIRLRAKC